MEMPSRSDDMINMLFACPNLVTYWQRVVEKVNTSLGTVVDFTDALCLLNNLKGNERIGAKKAQWLKVVLTMAKRVLLRHWMGEVFLPILNGSRTYQKLTLMKD